MDTLSKELQTFLVRMGISPESIDHQTEHEMRHLLTLLQPEAEEALIQYFGLFGSERFSLHEIAIENGVSDETMIERIDLNLRKLAITPEWQLIKQSDKARSAR